MKKIKRMLNVFARLLDDIFLLLGITFLSLGVFKIYPPAGYITLGVCFLAGAYFYAQSR